MFQLNSSPLTTSESFFINQAGSYILLRGVNFSGSSKVPYMPSERSDVPIDYENYRQVSFVGRPAPLEDLDIHFQRLRSWGFNFLRWLVTWEAIEHEGEGIYDQEYLDYLYRAIKKAGDYGFYVWIDPHQDVWSRFTGGDGSPGWIFDLVGMNMKMFPLTGTAFLHNAFPKFYPHMSWPHNYIRTTVSTMFTLFFGGKKFAPHLKISGADVQSYLQQLYFNSMSEVAKRLCGFDHVIGYGSMNEPFSGYIGRTNLDKWEVPLKLGPITTPLENMALGMGYRMKAPFYIKSTLGHRYLRDVHLNHRKQTIWKNGFNCPWFAQGVWEYNNHGVPVIQKPDFFTSHNGQPVSFWEDHLKPFINAFAEKIRSIHKNAIIFVEGEPQPDKHDILTWTKNDAPNIVNSSHFYDGKLLFTKTYHRHLTIDSPDGRKLRPVIGFKNVQRFYIRYLKKLAQISANQMNNIPTVIGEFGIPYDMNERIGFRDGDYRLHTEAVANYYQALDKNLLSATQWNYTSDNEHKIGDSWNFEDFSIYCDEENKSVNKTKEFLALEQIANIAGFESQIHKGGRGILGFSRPFAWRTPGKIIAMHFNEKYQHQKPSERWQVKQKNWLVKTIKYLSFLSEKNTRKSFFLEIELADSQAKKNEEAVIYIPLIHFPHGYEIVCENGSHRIESFSTGYHLLFWQVSPESGRKRLMITGKLKQ